MQLSFEQVSERLQSTLDHAPANVLALWQKGKVIGVLIAEPGLSVKDHDALLESLRTYYQYGYSSKIISMTQTIQPNLIFTEGYAERCLK